MMELVDDESLTPLGAAVSIVRDSMKGDRDCSWRGTRMRAIAELEVALRD
jgi:hypothetical protein